MELKLCLFLHSHHFYSQKYYCMNIMQYNIGYVIINACIFLLFRDSLVIYIFIIV